MPGENQTVIAATPSKSRQLYWLLQILGWSLYTLLRVIAAFSALQISWITATVEVTVLDLLGLAASHGLRAFIQRRRWAELTVPQLAVRIIIAGVVIGVPLGIATQFSHVADLQDPRPVLQDLVPGLSETQTLPFLYALQIINWAILFVIWQSIYFIAVGLREHRSAQLRHSELARALQQAELRLLKSQLKPHFLFNSLNTIQSLIADDPARARNAVTRLANTLRHTLRTRPEELVTLAQEMTIVDDYLELESMRFEEKLSIEKELSPDSVGELVPVMLLQTLVENAIKHGIADLPSGGLLRIRASLEEDRLVIQVENPRPPTRASKSDEGVGLHNARERLRLLFDGRASLELDLSTPLLVTARLCIPRKP